MNRRYRSYRDDEDEDGHGPGNGRAETNDDNHLTETIAASSTTATKTTRSVSLTSATIFSRPSLPMIYPRFLLGNKNHSNHKKHELRLENEYEDENLLNHNTEYDDTINQNKEEETMPSSFATVDVDSFLEEREEKTISWNGLSSSSSFSSSSSPSLSSFSSSTSSLVGPLAYRFYRQGSNIPRKTSWSKPPPPFVLLGPNVDHWKATGEELAALGFTAIACERVPPESSSSSSQQQPRKMPLPELSPRDCANLILDLLDALRWNRAVLVACDSESVLAIHAAQLLQDRIAGLVLCGHLGAAEDFVNRKMQQNLIGRRTATDPFVVDRFLRQSLECPFTIVWDGDCGDNSLSSKSLGNVAITGSQAETVPADAQLTQEREVILGSGSAPHRRRPELLAWTLARFVEQRVNPWSDPSITSHARDLTESNKERQNHQHRRGLLALLGYTKDPNSNNWLFLDRLAEFFSPECTTMVVMGRTVAWLLLYGVAVKVGLYQYYHWKNKIFDLQSKVQLVIPTKLAALIRGILLMHNFHPPKPQQKPDAKQTNESHDKDNQPVLADDQNGMGDQTINKSVIPNLDQELEESRREENTSKPGEEFDNVLEEQETDISEQNKTREEDLMNHNDQKNERGEEIFEEKQEDELLGDEEAQRKQMEGESQLQQSDDNDKLQQDQQQAEDSGPPLFKPYFLLDYVIA